MTKRMDDKTVQRKLDQLARIANELQEEAERRYGTKAMLFYESDSGFHFMSGDKPDGACEERTSFVELSSRSCRMECGSW